MIIDKTQVQEIIEANQKLADDFWISTKKLAWILWDSRNYLDEILENKNKYVNFWSPDENQKNMIDSWDKEFRNKMEWILTFEENTTTILINWEKLVFDKDQPIKEKMNWNNSIENVEKMDRGLLSNIEIKNLLFIFKSRSERDKLNDILDIYAKVYWTNTPISDNNIYIWSVYFGFGDILNNYSREMEAYVLCKHNN